MVKISTKGRYSLRVMLDLATHHTGEFIPLKDIARRQGVPIKYLEQVVGALNKAGYLRSLRGNGGGYRLSREPEGYVVGDILRTAEGSLAPLSCQEAEGCGNACCPAAQFWSGLNRVIGDYVNQFTLADLVEQQAWAALDYCI